MDYQAAELAVQQWMQRNGFEDATLTSPGADAGVDVVTRTAVAQVKAEARPVGRPNVQRIHGAAVNHGKAALFFSLSGYSQQAREWAEEAGVALFVFDHTGHVEPANVHAFRLMDGRTVSEAVALQDELVVLRPGDSEGEEVAFDLLFTYTDCPSCGNESPKASGCGFCGALDPSDDPYVTRRRRLVEKARARVTTPEKILTDTIPPDILDRLKEEDVIGNQLRLISEVAEADETWESRYAQVMRAFERTLEMARRSTSRSQQPWVLLWPHIDQMTAHAVEAVHAYERMLTASTPELAASYNDAAQTALSRFTVATDGLNEATRTADGQVNGSGCLTSSFAVVMVLSLLLMLGASIPT